MVPLPFEQRVVVVVVGEGLLLCVHAHTHAGTIATSPIFFFFFKKKKSSSAQQRGRNHNHHPPG
jgi:hypothetical protein